MLAISWTIAKNWQFLGKFSKLVKGISIQYWRYMPKDRSTRCFLKNLQSSLISTLSPFNRCLSSILIVPFLASSMSKEVQTNMYLSIADPTKLNTLRQLSSLIKDKWETGSVSSTLYKIMATIHITTLLLLALSITTYRSMFEFFHPVTLKESLWLWMWKENSLKVQKKLMWAH